MFNQLDVLVGKQVSIPEQSIVPRNLQETITGPLLQGHGAALTDRQQHGSRRCSFLVSTNKVTQKSWRKKKEKEKEACRLKWYVSLCVWTIF